MRELFDVLSNISFLWWPSFFFDVAGEKPTINFISQNKKSYILEGRKEEK
jgi:hypothetical protein